MLKAKRHIGKNYMLHIILEYLLFIIGCLIVAMSFNFLLLPNKIASGGVVGLSIIASHLFDVNPAYVQWIMNIPVFFLGLFFLGWKTGFKSLLGSFALPFFILLTQNVQPLTENPLLAVVYGGIGIGTGLGLVFRSKGSIGGFTIISRIIEKYSGISIGTAAMIMDGVIIIIAGFVFNAESALYAFIVVFLMSKTVDIIQMGLNTSKVAFVISSKADGIAEGILNEISRGVTKLQGTGAYTDENKVVLMVVVDQTEISRFKQLIKTIDPQAFVIINNAHEVLGEGFKLHS